MEHFVTSSVKLLWVVITLFHQFTGLNVKAIACYEYGICYGTFSATVYELVHSVKSYSKLTVITVMFSAVTVILSSYCQTCLQLCINLLVSRLHRAVYAVSSLLRVGSPGTRGGIY